jgi:phage shock protein PspC (stress-responsive transcriptional regulator)
MDLIGSHGLASTMHSYQEQLQWPDFHSANYCNFTQQSKQYFVVQDAGCHWGFRCLMNNSLIQYQDTECKKIRSFGDTSLVTVQGDNLKLKWIASVPSSVLSPRFKYPSEWIGMICIVIALFISLVMNLYYFMAMKTLPETSYWLAISNALCLGFVIMRICYWVIHFPDMISWVILQWVEVISFNIATLLSSWTTLKTLIKYFHVNNTTLVRIFFVLLLTVHVGLAGSGYVLYWKYYGVPTVGMLYWNRLRPFWTLCVYVFNTIPAILMFKQLSQLRFSQKTLQDRSLNGTLFLGLLLAQVFNSIVHFVLQYLGIYTDLLFTDNNFLAMNGPNSLVDVSNYILTYLLNFNLLQILHSKLHPAQPPLKISNVFKKGIRSTPQTQPRVEQDTVKLDRAGSTQIVNRSNHNQV